MLKSLFSCWTLIHKIRYGYSDKSHSSLIQVTFLFSYYIQEEEDGGHMDLDLQRKGKLAVIKTSTRQVATPMFFF